MAVSDLNDGRHSAKVCVDDPCQISRTAFALVGPRPPSVAIRLCSPADNRVAPPAAARSSTVRKNLAEVPVLRVNGTMTSSPGITRLDRAVTPSPDKLINPDALSSFPGAGKESRVLVILAAGKGTRFGQAPKCIQPVHGTPLARHSIDGFRRFTPAPVVCLVGYRHDEVSAALGPDNIYVRSDNPAGGTAYAAYEAFSVPGLLESNPLLVITMGDRIVTTSVFRRLCETHGAGGREADLTMLTAEYEPPKNRGKGRVVRAENGRVIRIVEQRDIDRVDESQARNQLQSSPRAIARSTRFAPRRCTNTSRR